MSEDREILNSRADVVFNVTLVLAIVATCFVGLRITSKWIVVKRNNSDDVFTIIAWVLMLGLSCSIMVGAKFGLGAPDSQIRPEDAMTLKKSLYAFTVLYNPALMATKTAILLLYIRMAAAHPFLRYASYGTLTIVNTAGIVLTFLNIFQCRPIRAAFDRDTGTCIDVVSLYLSSAPINVLTDLAILLLPLPILTRLRLEFRQKVALVATFTVGAFVTVVDVIRIVYLQDALREEVLAQTGDGGIDSIATSATAAATSSRDFTYHASFSLMWSAVEVSVGLMCCCVLVLKPLIMKVVPILLHSHRNSFSHNHTAGSRLGATDINTDGAGVDRGRMRSLSFMERLGQKSQASAMGQMTPDMGSNKDKFSPNPNLNMGTILESPSIPRNGDGEEDDDEDDGGMDFFQMLAADPQTSTPIAPIAAPRHITLPDTNIDTVAPLSFPPSFASPTAETPPTPLPSAEPKVPFANISRKFSRHATMLSFSGTRTRKESVDPSQGPTQTFFDFVNMNGTKPLTELSAKEAWWPILFVSILFFLWGFAYGLLGTLNGEIISLLSISPARSIALHNAYWLGYLVGPPAIGHWVLTRAGFKAAFMTGLAIYACGAMAFWPSSVLRSYAGFFISNFMIACGLSVLEIAANPFIAIAGPGRLSEARLCFSQGIQAIGGFSSPILAQKALFQRVEGIDLFRVQWCYLAVALFVTFLAVVFFYVPLSEASDSDLEAVALQRLDSADLDQKDRVWGKIKIGHFVLATGVLAMFLYVGAQESVSYFWDESMQAVKPGTDSFWNSAISHGMFAIGRFLVSLLAFLGIPPRILLAVSIVGAFITSLLGLLLPRGNAPLAMLLLTVFFESAIFPLLFAMTIRNQGRHTKLASSLLTMAISGGAVWPSVTYGVVTLHPDPTGTARQAIKVTVALYGLSTSIPAAWQPRLMRRWLDPKWSTVPVGRRGSTPSSGWVWPHMNEKGEVAHNDVDVSSDKDGLRRSVESPAMEMKERRLSGIRIS